jgi:lysophospholipase L1-like esterase
MRAIAGLTVQQMIERAPKHVTPVYDPDAPFNILAVTEVLNSLAEGETKENTYRQLVYYCHARRAEGWKVVVAPPLPAGAGIKQADLDWVKDQIVANWKTFADAIVRADRDPNIGSWTAWATDGERKLYRNDRVHFTPLGNEIYARYWVQAINELLLSLENATGSTARNHGGL